MKLRTGAVIFLTLLTGVSKAETIPTVKIPNYVSKHYFGINNTDYRGDTGPQLCAKLPGNFYWQPEYHSCQNQNDKYSFHSVSEYIVCAGGGWDCSASTESCPAGYEFKYGLYGAACYRPDDGCERDPKKLQEIKLLAAIIHGESTDGKNYDEMQALASATLRRVKAAGQGTVNGLIEKYPRYSFVVCDKNDLFNKLICDPSETKYQKAYDAARSALEGREDKSNGGCFWDGKDLDYRGVDHPTYKRGFKFSDASHNIFNIKEPPAKNKRGTKGAYYDYTYISTAAYGKTVFWKVSDEYLKANGAKQCK